MTTLTLRRMLIAMVAVLMSFQGAAVAQSPNTVTDLSMFPGTPNVIKFGEMVWVYFNYDTTEMAGVRIWARPISIDPVTGQDMLTPNYGACGSPLHAAGNGSGSSCFSIFYTGTGNVTVDKVRVQMWDANGTTLLFSAKVPVHFKFR